MIAAGPNSIRIVQVVEADLDDKASLARAFEGSYGVFCVANYWEHFSPERETAQGRNLAEAATPSGCRATNRAFRSGDPSRFHPSGLGQLRRVRARYFEVAFAALLRTFLLPRIDGHAPSV
jgi:uncharacterized protein YbjT (DUF2867 family)